MNESKYSRTPLSASIALAISATAATPIYAQDENQDENAESDTLIMETVTVTGIRRSLEAAADVKRESGGVVDAIMAEDIGKFPDTNLAEAMQRITGVSIDRTSQRGAEGEGQRITVRGVGPDFNLVLLNGRQMPGTSINATSASDSRAFDFANLASESVAGVEVYKTSLANIPTGGIGATINIKTARPLDANERRLSLGAKALLDTSREDDSWSPEISGIYSDVFADGKFGIALSGIYQEREYGYNQAGTFSGWIPETRLEGWQALPAPGAPVSENFTNIPSESDLYSLPQNLGYATVTGERERLNGQLVLQFAPQDNLEFTLDYTYSEMEVQERRNDIGVWFIQCGPCGGSFGTFTDGPIVTPLVWSEDWTNRDVGAGGGKDGFKTELDSIGFNAQWDFSDNVSFHLDYHDSTSQTGRASPFGSAAVIGGVLFTSGGRVTVDYSSDFPVLSMDLPAGEFDGSNLLTGGASFRSSFMKSNVEQIDLGGVWDIDDTKSLDFGVTSTEVSNRTAFREVTYPNWGGIGSPDDYPDDLWQVRDIRSLFNNVSGSGDPNLWNQMFIWNFADVAAAREAATGQVMGASDDFNVDRRTIEESTSAYVQFNTNFDIGDKNANLRVGVRYEETDVDSSALVPIPQYISWDANNEYFITFGDPDFSSLQGKYDYFLPNLDFDISLTEDVILRASYSETIGRPGWNDISGGQSLTTLVRRNFGNATQGDPGLLPLESKNYDLSAEWYYDEGSYLAAAYFLKDTKNYVGDQVIEGTPFNLPHPGNGMWYDECNAATGGGDDQGAIRQCIFTTYADSPFVTITGTDVNGNFTGSIQGQPGDPAANFIISVPTNSQAAEIDGFEVAWQHMWGDSGFGSILNYTVVDSDIGYDNGSVENQFAILGLSDSYNVVLFYDKDSWMGRLAYNWRDDFLTGTTDGNGIPNPVYVGDYGQLDAIVSYTFENGVTVAAEAINLTDEYTRLYSRRIEQHQFVTQLGPRYGISARWVW